MKKLEKTLNLEHNLLQAAFLMVAAAMTSFVSPFYLVKGYTNTQIGLHLTVGSLLAIIGQPIFADFVDRTKRFNTVEMMMIVSVIPAILFIPLYFMKEASLLLSIISVLASATFSLVGPLFAAIGFKMSETGIKTDYGFARAFGSLSYAATCFVMGRLVDKFGGNFVPIVVIFTDICLLIVCAFTNKTFHENHIGEVVHSENTQEEDDTVSFKDFIKNNTSLMLLCLSVPFIMFTSNIIGYYLIQIIEPLGGTITDSGNLSSLAAVLELPCMMGFSKIESKLKLNNVLTIAAITYAIKAITVYLSNNMTMIYVAFCMQFSSFALFTPGMVEYINRHTTRKETVRGQALYTTITSVGTMIVSSLSGYIIDNLGVKTLTLVSAISCCFGVVLYIFLLNKNEKKKSS